MTSIQNKVVRSGTKITKITKITYYDNIAYGELK